MPGQPGLHSNTLCPKTKTELLSEKGQALDDMGSSESGELASGQHGNPRLSAPVGAWVEEGETDLLKKLL